MKQEIKKKYFGFVTKYISNHKICLSASLKKNYTENFFDDAVKDNILVEIEKNDIGERQFIFTDYARKIFD